MEDNKYVYVNTKPSNRARERFKALCSSAMFISSASLGSKSKTYRISLEEWESKKEQIRKYASLRRGQKL